MLFLNSNEYWTNGIAIISSGTKTLSSRVNFSLHIKLRFEASIFALVYCTHSVISNWGSIVINYYRPTSVCYGRTSHWHSQFGTIDHTFIFSTIIEWALPATQTMSLNRQSYIILPSKLQLGMRSVMFCILHEYTLTLTFSFYINRHVCSYQ